MRKTPAWILAFVMVLGLCVTASAAPAKDPIITTATGYDSADDVVYVTYTQSGKTVIANWGARGEDCVFLSTYAEDYYTGSYTWEVLSQVSGGTTTSNTPSSDLFGQLQDLMESTHTFYTYYDGNKNVRDYYRYTDCVSSDISQVALIYRGGLVSSVWDSGRTWNQEHCWPKSKLNTSEQIGDIVHLRPANPSENSSRGNKAYGESSGYYDPGVSVRGDCARMVLYLYVRYGVTGTMWGSSGVMESMDILLKWMEEDPVDTWEMGRNDSVQSITGVRNVFVDYPEYAWLLFGQEVPEDLVTPSGEAQGNEDTPCAHSNTVVRNASAATCGADGYTGDTYCTDCGELVSSGTAIPATGNHTLDSTGHCTGCDYYETPLCTHTNTQLRNALEATCGADGYTGDTYCADCGQLLAMGSAIPATGEHTLDGTGHCTGCDYYEAPQACEHSHINYINRREPTCGTDGYEGDMVCAVCGEALGNGNSIPATGEHNNITHRNQADATCDREGHTGDVYCTDCDAFIAGGSVIPALGHSLDKDGKCTVCGYQETAQTPTEPDHTEEPVQTSPFAWLLTLLGTALSAILAGGTIAIVILCAVTVIVVAAVVVVIVLIIKKKR